MTLTVSELSVARGGALLLERVNFTLAPGEALVLRGPNGVGKTSLLRTIAGLQPPLAGQIDGAEDQIAYAAHADGLKPTLSLRENLAFWAAIFGQRDIERAISAFDLTLLADRAAGALSAGQKRRLGLARMLVTGQPIWVLDEPTVSLDSTSVSLFARAVGQHLKTGGSALIATHIDLGLASERVLDLRAYRAKPGSLSASDGAFL